MLCITILHGCPPSEEIEPYCSCKDLSESTIMFCENIMCQDQFAIPIKALAKHHSNIYSLSIFNSSLLYVPDDIFKGTHIEQVILLSLCFYILAFCMLIKRFIFSIKICSKIITYILTIYL